MSSTPDAGVAATDATARADVGAPGLPDSALADQASGPAPDAGAEAAADGAVDAGPDCSAVLAAFMSAPIVPPYGWFGLDLSGGNAGDGGAAGESLKIDQTDLLRCATYVEPTVFPPGVAPSGPGYRTAYFAATQDAGVGAATVTLEYNVQSRAIFQPAVFAGYGGRLDFHSRAGGTYGNHQYSVTLATTNGMGGAVLRDGVAFAPDWSATNNAWANELYDAMNATFDPSQPQVTDCATSNYTANTWGVPISAADCYIQQYGAGGDYLGFRPLGLYWIFTSGMNQVNTMFQFVPGGRALSCDTPQAAEEYMAYSSIYVVGNGFNIGGVPTRNAASNADGLTASEANGALGCNGTSWATPDQGYGGMQWGGGELAMEYNLDSGVNYRVYAQSGYKGLWTAQAWPQGSTPQSYQIGIGVLQSGVFDDAGVNVSWSDVTIDWTSQQTAAPTVTALANAWYMQSCGTLTDSDCLAAGDCAVVVDDGHGHSSFTLVPSVNSAIGVNCGGYLAPITFVFPQGSSKPEQIYVENPLGWAFPGAPASGADAGASLGAWCPAYDGGIEYDPAAYDSGSVSPIEDGGGPNGSSGTLPGPAPVVCSGVGAPPNATLTVTNNAPCAIELWWVDFTCREVLYQVIPPGSTMQPTVETHAWRLRTSGTHELLRDIPPIASAAVSVTFP
jgi:hypothetical protein